MGNVNIYAALVNGDLKPIIENRSSKEIVTAFTGDDTGAPPSSVTIEVITESGSTVKFIFLTVLLMPALLSMGSAYNQSGKPIQWSPNRMVP